VRQVCADKVLLRIFEARPKARLSSPIRPMHVASRQTPNGVDHEKKRDPRSVEITETKSTELEPHAQLKKRTAKTRI
jgi:hypothetical protein